MIRTLIRFIIGTFIFLLSVGLLSDIMSGDTSNTPFVAISIFLFILVVLYRLIGKKTDKSCDDYICPECGSCIEDYDSKILIEQNYKYLTRSGLKDKRRKDNPLVDKYKLTLVCKNCNTTFELIEEVAGW